LPIWLAAGCARSRSQSVSVVPMIQWLPHGMMNSRLFSVRVMTPVALLIRFRGTTRWTPFDARTWNWPRPPTISRISSVQIPAALAAPADPLLHLGGPGPGGVDHVLRPDGGLPPALQVADPDAGDPVGVPEELGDPGAGDAQRAVRRRGPRQHHRVARVVALSRAEPDDAPDGRPLPGREGRRRAAAPQVTVVAGHPATGSHHVVDAAAQPHVGPVDGVLPGGGGG